MAFKKKGSIHKSGDITIEAFDGKGIKLADMGTGAAIGLTFETATAAIKVLTKLTEAAAKAAAEAAEEAQAQAAATASEPEAEAEAAK